MLAFEQLNASNKGDQALDECNTKVKELQKELAEERQQRKELEKKTKTLEQKQVKESKLPAKEHKGSASVSHPPQAKSLEQERGETDTAKSVTK